MSRDLLQEKIASFRLSNSLSGKMNRFSASLGYFNDIISDDDQREKLPMLSEMALLPKYDETRNKLRYANGVVNFVTGDGYGPLIDMILRTAFPPEDTGIYHMGLNHSIPEDYFVNARDVFGDINQDGAVNVGDYMDKLIFGTRKLWSLDYVEKNGITDEMLQVIFPGNVQSVTDAEAENLRMNQQEVPERPKWEVIKEAMEGYKAEMDDLNDENNDIKNNLTTLFTQIVRERETRRFNFLTRRENRGLPKDKRKELKPQMNNDAFAELVEKFDLYRMAYNNAKMSIEAKYASVLPVIRKVHSQGVVRNEDGFLHNDPSKQMSEAKDICLKVTRDYINPKEGTSPETIRSKLAKIVSVFVGRISEIEAFDVTTKNIKSEVDKLIPLPLIKDKTKDNSIQIVNLWLQNQTRILSLVNSLIERLRSKGSVMVFSNVDNSALAKEIISGREESRYTSGIKPIMEAFDEACSSQASRLSRATGSTHIPGSGRKVIVLVSNSKLSNLGFAKVIEMENYPVDDAEAEIIVRHMIGPYIEYAKRLYEEKARIQIENNKSLSPQERKAKLEDVRRTVAAKEDLISKINSDDMVKIRQLLVGKGQKQAIEIMAYSLDKYVKFEIDKDTGAVSDIDVDSEVILDGMRNDITESGKAGVKGITGTKKPKIKFENYIYAKGEEWASRIGQFEVAKNAVEAAKENIAKYRDEIAKVRMLLKDPSLSKKDREELEERRKYITLELEKEYAIRDNTYPSLPHMTVLWGRPGVGKSFWADALGDLLDFVINPVNFGDTKNKWLGDSEKFAKQLFSIFLNSRNTIFLLDEIDKQIMMNSNENAQSNVHETTQSLIERMLTMFEEEKDKFKSNNVFTVLTTNYPQNVTPALVARSECNTFEVKASKDPEDYYKLIITMVDTAKRKTPDAPWVYHMPEGFIGKWDNDAKWKATYDLINSIDIMGVAKQFAEKEFSYRMATDIIRSMVFAHTTYLSNRMLVRSGKSKNLVGIPFTKENVLASAKRAVDITEGTSAYRDGVTTVQAEIEEKTKSMLKSHPLEETEEPDPITGKTRKVFKVPDAIENVVSHYKEEEQETEQKWEAGEEIDPSTGKFVPFYRRKVDAPQPQTPTGKTMEELEDEGFSKGEIPQGEVEGETIPSTDSKSTKEKGNVNEKKVTSTTDYYYEALRKNGLIKEQEKKEAQNLQPMRPIQKPRKKKYWEMSGKERAAEAERYGVYYYSEDQIMILPFPISNKPTK